MFQVAALRAALLLCGICIPGAAGIAADFSVSSTNLHDGAAVPLAQVLNRSGCDGGNQSPQISWSGEPAGTRSFVVTLFDPDAPSGHGWWHWIVFDIAANVHNLPEGAGAARSQELPPAARQGRNDFGFTGYGGPCPPAGSPPHRYVLSVFALKSATLPLEEGASGAELQAALRSSAIAVARIVAHYGRD